MGKERFWLSNLLQGANKITVMFLRIVVTVFLVVATGFVFTRVLNFIGAIPQRWIIYGNQQINFSSKGIDQKDFENIRLIKENLNDDKEGDLLAMLSILAIFGGILAYIFNVIVRRDLQNESEKTQERMRHYTTAQSLKGLGILNYRRYMDTGEKNKDLLEKAEEHTKKGLRSAIDLYKLENCPDHELILCILKNNMACMIFRKKEYARKHEALEYINYAITKSGNHPDHADEWFDTKKKVLDTFFDGKDDSVLKSPK